MTEYKVDWTSQHVANWLRYLGKFTGQLCYGLEIGCYEGRSTVWFIENIMTHPNSMLTCVDPFDPVTQKVQYIQEAPLSRFLENTENVFRKLYLYNMPSAKFWADGRAILYDWIYVDGSHELVHTSTDIVCGWEKLKKGGIMIIDDYMDSRILSAPDLPNAVPDDVTYEDVFPPPERDYRDGFRLFPVRDAVNNFIKVYNPKVHELGFQAILEKE